MSTPTLTDPNLYSRIKLLVAYDGTEYAGWQRQSDDSADTRPTLQASLENALSKIFNEPVKAQSSGRTDAGAHADGQIVHFDLPRDPVTNLLKRDPSTNLLKHDPQTLNQNSKLLRSLNALTPHSLAVKRIWLAPSDFHALHSATHKTYRYVIHNDLTLNPQTRNHTYWHEKPLNIQALNSLTEPLLGKHDFKSFQTRGTELKTTVRKIFEARWSENRENPHNQLFSAPFGRVITLHITGSGFLKQMVRNIVGTAIYLHDNAYGPSEMAQILASQSRQMAKTTAPACGLFLEKVYYPDDLDKRCLEL
jgi:tRNA pseudouridine38-40 synthase